MSRTARQLPEKGVFHVLVRGNNRAPVFHRPADYRAYLHILGDTLKDFPIQLHHYCLMPNHIHLLVSSGPPASALSRLMHRVQLSYAIYYKAHYEYVGHLWQGRFKALWIESERYFFICSAYIELNPVAAGMTKNPAEYPFSSYLQYALGEKIPYLKPHLFYEQMGSTPEERQKVFRAMVETRLATRAEDQLTVGFSAGLPGRPKKRDASESVPFSISFGQ